MSLSRRSDDEKGRNVVVVLCVPNNNFPPGAVFAGTTPAGDNIPSQGQGEAVVV